MSALLFSTSKSPFPQRNVDAQTSTFPEGFDDSRSFTFDFLPCAIHVVYEMWTHFMSTSFSSLSIEI